MAAAAMPAITAVDIFVKQGGSEGNEGRREGEESTCDEKDCVQQRLFPA
jgi:hypothetical protein